MFEKYGYSRQSCRLRISPRIRSQNQNGLKDSVRDLGQSDLFENIEKTGSLPCPFKHKFKLRHPKWMAGVCFMWVSDWTLLSELRNGNCVKNDKPALSSGRNRAKKIYYFLTFNQDFIIIRSNSVERSLSKGKPGDPITPYLSRSSLCFRLQLYAK